MAQAGEGPLILPSGEVLVPTPKYCESIYQTRRRPTRTVHVRAALRRWRQRPAAWGERRGGSGKGSNEPQRALAAAAGLQQRCSGAALCARLYTPRWLAPHTLPVPCPCLLLLLLLLLPFSFLLHPQVGPVKVGSEHPMALQTMTTTDTRDVEATVEQVPPRGRGRWMGRGRRDGGSAPASAVLLPAAAAAAAAPAAYSCLLLLLLPLRLPLLPRLLLPPHPHPPLPPAPLHTTTTPQVKRCADAGAAMVRITVQGKKEAEACMRIRERLFQDR